MYRLLIVDDEEEIRTSLARYFPWNEIGFEVAAVAEDGSEALDIIRKGGVDVVLADIRMPVLSGIDLAKTIFEERLGVSVIFLSAYRDFAYAQKAIEYGVRRYVLKPTEYAEITAVFAELKSSLDTGITRSDVEDGGGEATAASPRAEAVIELIKSYALREYPRATLTGAARIARLNPQYASRLFRNVTGEHFNEYLMRIKMTKAAELLRDVRYCTYEVSEIVGYSNPKNFSRSFKRHFGVSPHDFRRVARNPERGA